MRILLAILTMSILNDASAHPADLLVALNKSDDTASILDAKSGAVRGTIPVGHGPHEVEVLAGRRTAVVANYGDRERPGRTLTLIDLDKMTALSTIELPEGARPHGLDALSDGRLLVTAEGLRELLVVDPKTGKVAARIPTERDVSHMVVASPAGDRAYVASIGSGSVTVVDLAAGKVLRQIATGKGSEGIDVTPDGREVWVVNREADTIAIVDTTSLVVAATIPATKFPIRIKITRDGKRALVSCAESGDVAVFDVAGRKEIRRISIARKPVAGSQTRALGGGAAGSPAPVGLLIAPDGGRAWVAATNADVVCELDLASYSVTAERRAGKEPDGLAGRFAVP